MAKNSRLTSSADESAGSCKVKSNCHIVRHTQGLDWAASTASGDFQHDSIQLHWWWTFVLKCYHDCLRLTRHGHQYHYLNLAGFLGSNSSCPLQLFLATLPHPLAKLLSSWHCQPVNRCRGFLNQMPQFDMVTLYTCLFSGWSRWRWSSPLWRSKAERLLPNSWSLLIDSLSTLSG